MNEVRERGPLDSLFESGYVPADEPPGITEHEYRRWKESGGTVKNQPETPPTWAVVELMGHLCHAGRLSEEEKFGVKLGRVDVPADDGTFTTVFFGGASVYKITVVTEAVARVKARQAKPQPVSPWDFPKQLQAALARDANDVEDDDPPDEEPDYPV